MTFLSLSLSVPLSLCVSVCLSVSLPPTTHTHMPPMQKCGSVWLLRSDRVVSEVRSCGFWGQIVWLLRSDCVDPGAVRPYAAWPWLDSWKLKAFRSEKHRRRDVAQSWHYQTNTNSLLSVLTSSELLGDWTLPVHTPLHKQLWIYTQRKNPTIWTAGKKRKKY